MNLIPYNTVEGLLVRPREDQQEAFCRCCDDAGSPRRCVVKKATTSTRPAANSGCGETAEGLVAPPS
ncbi:MAG: hypothetical protein R3F31_01080 [Verrucomicrobiales bacterium]